MSRSSPEKMILTRLFTAQRRLRFVRGVAQGLKWFAAGTVMAAVSLVALWNWNRLPGPWQWLASAGRPVELLWLPPLLALGGFASRWLVLPAVRETAYKVDGLRQSQERLLTAVDWILSEKPRTGVSERLLAQAARDLEDEQRLRQDLRRLEKVPRRSYTLLLSIAFPLLLLYFLPSHARLPDSAAVWLGTNQVERLTEAMVEELEQAPSLEKPEEKIKQLLKKLQDPTGATDPTEKVATEQSQRELQRMVDELQQMARAQQSARQLLETLAQRARQDQDLSEKDKEALEQLKELMDKPAQKESLEKAESDWKDGKGEKAAEALESLQQEAGQAAQDLKEMAAEGQVQAEAGQQPGQGKEFNENQGDQHPQDGEGKEHGQGKGQGRGKGQGQGDEGVGEPGDFGKGSTENEEQGPNAAGNQRHRQSDRVSDKHEEFKNLHEPVRVEIETSQTRVQGTKGENGPRYRTEKEGLGAVTEPFELESGGGLLDYQESAENALLREEIPADCRDQVRQYFEGLDK